MSTAKTTPEVVSRPWFREPWVWFIIALPASAVIGCAITIWLAITRPDFLVVEEQEYQNIRAELRAQNSDQPGEQIPAKPGESNGDG